MEELYGVQKAKKKELAQLNIKDFIFKYIRFLPYFILSLLLCLFLAWLYLRYSTPIYRSTGSMLIVEPKKDNNKLEDYISSGTELNIQSEVELLRSKPMMQRVVKNLNLNYTYHSKGKVKEVDQYNRDGFELQALKLNDSTKNIEYIISFDQPNSFLIKGYPQRFSFNRDFSTNDGTFRIVKTVGRIQQQYRVAWEPSEWKAAELSGKVAITPKGTTNILILVQESTHPERAADILNELMKEYKLYSVEQKNQTILQQIAFINDRMRIVDAELDSVTSHLLAFQRDKDFIDYGSQSSAVFTTITSSENKIIEAQTQSEVLGIIQDYLSSGKNNYATTPTALTVSDPTLGSLIGAYNAAQLERKLALDNERAPDHPLVKAQEATIEKLRQKIQENLRVIRTALNNQLSDLQRQNTAAQREIRAMPEKQQRFLVIERQKETKQNVMNILLEEKERTSIKLAAITSDITIVDKALPNATPVSPNKTSTYALAALIGLGLPALFIFLKEMFNDKILSRNDIEHVTTVPVLGEIGHSYADQALIVRPKSRGVVAEQFRIIRSNLQYIIKDHKNPAILVTSSFSGEGKSYISTNLGAVMALGGRKTIVLEFDIRKPRVMQHLNMSAKKGFVNFVVGQASLEELIIPIPGFDNYFVLPCGPTPPNPAELLLDPAVGEVFKYLKANFEAIIVDTAPVGMVSDALTLSPFIDATLYITRQNVTFKKQIGLIDNFYIENKMPHISIVLNDVKQITGYGYYGYGRYGYGYGYGSGYFDDDTVAPASRWERLMNLMGLQRQKKGRNYKKGRAKAKAEKA